MTGTAMNASYLALMLILPIAALAARRLPLGATMKMVLAWVAIFVILALVVVLIQGPSHELSFHFT